MYGKEEFKEFVKNNPKLVKFVKSGEKTWQNFYEIYSLYGSDDEVWKDYLDIQKDFRKNETESFDLLSWLKSIDLDSIQNGVLSIQRVLGVLEDLTNNNDTIKDEYKPRPIYKHFED